MNLVVTPPDREGFLFLNPTAAWIWQNSATSELASKYADRFGIALSQAELDIRQTFAQWGDWQNSFDEWQPSLGEVVTGVESVIHLRINETTYEVRFETETLSAELLPRLSALEIPICAPQHKFQLREFSEAVELSKDGVRFAIEPLVTGGRAILLQELTRLAVPGRDFTAILHAGAVSNGGSAVILAGSSFSGKSTLCTALMEAGFTCLSDDSACLTQDFQVAGMPFALSLREGAWPLFPHLQGRRFIPSNLHGESPSVPVSSLVFVQYQPEAATKLEPVDVFSALVEIQKCGFWVNHTEEAIGALLDWLARLPIYRLTYSSLPGAIAEIVEI